MSRAIQVVTAVSRMATDLPRLLFGAGLAKVSKLMSFALPWRLSWNLRSPEVTISLTFDNSTFCSHGIFVCFVWIGEQTAIISIYGINWQVFITETERVHCAVRNGYLKETLLNLSLQGPCRASDGQWPVSHNGGPGSIPDHSTWNSWRMKRHRDSFDFPTTTVTYCSALFLT
jgi:hypothetical protein